MSPYDDPHVSAAKIVDYFDQEYLAIPTLNWPQPPQAMEKPGLSPNLLRATLVLLVFSACVYLAIYLILR